MFFPLLQPIEDFLFQRGVKKRGDLLAIIIASVRKEVIVNAKIFLAFFTLSVFGICFPLYAFPAQMASQSYRISTSCFSSLWDEIVSVNYSSEAVLGQSSPVMDSDNQPLSTNFDNQPGFIYTLDAVLECESPESFARAYGTTAADSRYNPACEWDFDGDIDGIDLSRFIESF